MQIRRSSREFKVEAVKLVRERGLSAARDLGVHENVLRKWVKEFGSDPVQAFSSHGQMKPEQLEIERLRREVNKLKAEREILKKAAAFFAKAQLVADALLMAVWRRDKPDALMRHSDRGSQYASEQFQRLMVDSGIVCSMSRSGNVWDNAAMESFFSSLKTECIERKTYRTMNEARADVFDYIERF